jgi:hypothetical protein
MNSFWNNLYDRYRDRRYATLFLAALGMFFGLIILGVILCLCTGLLNTPEGFVAVGFGFGVFIAALVWRAIRRAWALRGNPSTFSPLSRDELTKARSKLVKGRNFEKL